MGRFILSIIIIFVVAFLVGWVNNGIILKSIYEQRTDIFYNMEEMNMTVSMILWIISWILMTFLYKHFVVPKNLKTGLLFGFVLGIFMGITFFSYYYWMRIDFNMAIAWGMEGLIDYTAAGLIWGLIIKEPEKST